MKISTCFLVVILAPLLLSCGTPPRSSQEVPRNLVIIVSDSLRYDIIGAYGGAAHTPNIDHLIATGTSFQHAYSCAPRTLPSSVGMMTAHIPASYPLTEKKKGVRARYLVPDSEVLFPELFKAAGFEATAFVANPNAYVSNNMQGFTLLPTDTKITPEQEQRVKPITRKIRADLRYHQTYRFVDYLLTRPDDTKFISLIWIDDPHVPYTPPEDFKKQIKADPAQLPRSFDQYAWAKPFMQYTDAEKQYSKALYTKEVESMDERVGFILAALRQRGLLKDTIVMFTADHGEQFGENDHVGHGNSYFQTLLHVPLIFSGPGIPRGKTITANVSQMDISRTLHDLFELPAPEPAGSSFAGLLGGKSTYKPHDFYFTGIHPKSTEYTDALLLNNDKLIARQDGSFLLFRLDKDPLEKRSIWPDGIPKKDKEIVNRILSFRQRTSKIRKEIETAYEEGEKSINRPRSFETKSTIQKLKSLGYIK